MRWAIAIVLAAGCSDPCDTPCMDMIHVTAHSDTAIAPSPTAMVNLCIDSACGTGTYAAAQVMLAGSLTATATATAGAGGLDVELDYAKGAMLKDGNVFGLDVYDDATRVDAISDPAMYGATCGCKTLALTLVLAPR